MEAPAEALQSWPEIDLSWLASVRAFADEPRNPPAHRPPRQKAGVTMTQSSAGAVSYPGPLAGKVFVLTGTLAAMSRERRPSRSSASARAWLVGEQENELRRWREATPAAARKGATARR